MGLIVDNIRRKSLPVSKWPTTLLVISDMQFDTAQRNCGGDDGFWSTTYEKIEKMFKALGGPPPKIVFWNVQFFNDWISSRVWTEGCCAGQWIFTSTAEVHHHWGDDKGYHSQGDASQAVIRGGLGSNSTDADGAQGGAFVWIQGEAEEARARGNWWMR